MNQSIKVCKTVCIFKLDRYTVITLDQIFRVMNIIDKSN